MSDINDPAVITLAGRISEFVKDQPVPRVSLALLRVLATVLAEIIDTHVEMLRANAAEQYERLSAIQRAASGPTQGND
jgi:hypothetical protein